MENYKERHDWIDYLRFITMFYIYLGHFGTSAGKIYPFVFTFHVPLFFFISGILVRTPKTNNDVLRLLTNSFKRIMIPYAFFSIVGVIFLTIKDDRDFNNILQMIEMSILGVRNNTPLATLWFFPCLFVVFSYYYLLNRIISSKLFIFLLSLIIYTITPIWFGQGIPKLFWNIDSAAYFLVFFSAGALLGEPLKKGLFSFKLDSKNIVSMIFVIILVLYSAACYQKGTFTFYKGLQSLELQYFCFFFAAFIIFIPNIYLARYIEHKAKSYNLKPILSLGRNTLVLCGTEQILKYSIVAFFGTFGIKIEPHNPLESILYTAFCFIIAYFSTVRLYAFFSKN
ncbi:acyltransferase family protein [Yersinia ruckeri]|uniref:acyltransferase family protein n=1 Tax=Yersinia ruckeri TaxID=29486 RepID=UPI0020BFD8D3|nr:acyltransferase family protein [Yersinia ruckeri]MCK8584829.1 acyltransferase family protein [Yersinia ruckeri]